MRGTLGHTLVGMMRLFVLGLPLAVLLSACSGDVPLLKGETPTPAAQQTPSQRAPAPSSTPTAGPNRVPSDSLAPPRATPTVTALVAPVTGPRNLPVQEEPSAIPVPAQGKPQGLG